MNLLKGRILLTVCVTLFSFLSVGYMACSKEQVTPSNDACATMTCKNGGNCFKGVCTCPAGFDGKFCEAVWITPYLGNWNITEVITGSNIKTNKGTERKYTWAIKAHPKPYMFLIDNLMGNADFSGIDANIGGATGRQASEFTINAKAFSADSMKTQVTGGKGTINSVGTMINGQYVISYIRNGQPTVDTISYQAIYKQ